MAADTTNVGRYVNSINGDQLHNHLRRAEASLRRAFQELRLDGREFQELIGGESAKGTLNRMSRALGVINNCWFSMVSAALFTSLSPLGGLVFSAACNLSDLAIDQILAGLEVDTSCENMFRDHDATVRTISIYASKCLASLVAAFAVTQLMGFAISWTAIFIIPIGAGVVFTVSTAVIAGIVSNLVATGCLSMLAPNPPPATTRPGVVTDI